jgi:hypothetical protein
MKLKAQREIAALYTAISRAKQGTLIFDSVSSGQETVSKLINSIRTDKLVDKKMSEETIINYGNKRKEILEKVLGEYKKTPPPDWKPVTNTNTPNTEEPDND